MTPSTKAVRCFVSGRVQGVFYRASTAREATRLGVSGWVRNLSDGRVEVLAGGDPEAIEALCSWLWQGPPEAAVDGVRIEHAEEFSAKAFEVR